MAARVDLRIEQGATFAKRFTARRRGTKERLDLTGYTARMQLRPAHGSSTVLLDLSTENERISIDGPNGVVDVVAAAELLAPFAFDEAVYDLVLTTPAPDSRAVRLVQGRVFLSPAVTS